MGAALGITVSPLSSTMGAEVEGFGMEPLDLAHLDDEVFASIDEAFEEHRLLVFRDQRLTQEAFLALAHRFGTPMRNPFPTGPHDHRQLTRLIKEPDEDTNFGGTWHADLTYAERPPKATLALAVEMPRAGGDTVFACQHRAYAGLSRGMQAILRGLNGIHSSAKGAIGHVGEQLAAGDFREAVDAFQVLTATHPVVIRHPRTGRPALFVNRANTVSLEGLAREESAPLLDYLFAHQVRPEFTTRLRWEPGTVAIWDNRSLVLFAINDYAGERRELWRVSLEGEKPEPAAADAETRPAAASLAPAGR